MKAITVTEQGVGIAGMTFGDLPYPHASENDVIVEIHASGFTPGELDWPGTWEDRAGRDRTPSIPGHEFAGIVVGLGYGTTGFTIGQRVFGMVHWTRDGSLAEYVAVETSGLAPLPADIDFVTAASLPISGLTAWQALFLHGQLRSGQTVMIHGIGGGVGSLAAQLAREAGIRVVGTGRARGRERALELGAEQYIDLESESLDVAGQVDVVLDVLGGDILKRSAALVRPGGTLISVAEPIEAFPENARGVFFVVEADRAQLTDIAERVRAGRLISHVGAVHALEQAQAAFTDRTPGKTIVRVK